MKKYMARWGKITEHEIERETEQSVWIRGNRRAKRSSYEVYFDSREEAKVHVIEKARRNLESAKSNLDSRRNELRDAEAL